MTDQQSTPQTDAVREALRAWQALPENERNGERPYIMGFNAGWEAALEDTAATPPAPVEGCQRCAVIEDLLETATSERDKARDEAAKADDETRELKVEMLHMRATGAAADYALVKEFQKRAEAAEAELAALRAPEQGERQSKPVGDGRG